MVSVECMSFVFISIIGMVMKPGKRQSSKFYKDTKIHAERSTTVQSVHQRLFCTHLLCMNFVTKTLALVTCRSL